METAGSGPQASELAAPAGCCARFRLLAPGVTLGYIILTSLLGLSFFIACLASSGSAACYLMEYSALMPYAIFERGQVWRLLTAHVVPSSLWQSLSMGILIGMTGFSLERSVGSLRYFGLLAYCVLIVDAITCAIEAILHFTPGLNQWSYFYEQWYTPYDLGPSPVLLFITILWVRTLPVRELRMWCCMFPTWAFILITWLCCQIFIWVPWYGLFYVASGAAAGYAVPAKWLVPNPSQLIAMAGVIMNPGQPASRRGCGKKKHEADASRRVQSDPEAGGAGSNAAWGARGRTLGSAELDDQAVPAPVPTPTPISAPAPAPTAAPAPYIRPGGSPAETGPRAKRSPGGASPGQPADPWGQGKKL